jgi:hypothetical protein
VPLLVATPGRLLDHLRTTASFKIDALEVLVRWVWVRSRIVTRSPHTAPVELTPPRTHHTRVTLKPSQVLDEVDQLLELGFENQVTASRDAPS